MSNNIVLSYLFTCNSNADTDVENRHNDNTVHSRNLQLASEWKKNSRYWEFESSRACKSSRKWTIRYILLYSGLSLSRLPSILKISHYFSGPVNIFTKYNLIYYLYLEYPSLKKRLWSRLNYSLTISNFLLACSVIQVSYRVSYENTIESFHFEYLENLECEFQNAKHPGD